MPLIYIIHFTNSSNPTNVNFVNLFTVYVVPFILLLFDVCIFRHDESAKQYSWEEENFLTKCDTETFLRWNHPKKEEFFPAEH